MKRKFLLYALLTASLLFTGCSEDAEDPDIARNQESSEQSLESSEELSQSEEEKEEKGSLVSSGAAYDFALGLLTNDPSLLYQSIYAPMGIYPEEESFSDFISTWLNDYFVWDVYDSSKDDFKVYAYDGYIEIEVNSQEMGPIHERYDLVFPMKDGKVVFEEIYVDEIKMKIPSGLNFTVNGEYLDLSSSKDEDQSSYQFVPLIQGIYQVEFTNPYLAAKTYDIAVFNGMIKELSFQNIIKEEEPRLELSIQSQAQDLALTFFNQVLDQIAVDSEKTDRIDNVSSILTEESKLALMKDIEDQINSLKNYNDPQLLNIRPLNETSSLKAIDDQSFQLRLELQFKIERIILQLPKNVALTVDVTYHLSGDQAFISSVNVHDDIRDLDIDEAK